MKKYLFVSILLLSLSFISCNGDKDIYYVKYEVEDDYFTSYGYRTHITVNTEIGYQNFEVVRTFNETFGPVDEDFVANIKVYTTPSDYNEKTVSIYVCKNDAPYVLKAYKKVSGTTVDLSYQIDF